MPTRTELRQRLADIDAILQSGVSQTTVDGVSTTFDLTSLRRERQEIQAKLGERRTRNRVFNLNMGGR